jgi:hypothetical protein
LNHLPSPSAFAIEPRPKQKRGQPEFRLAVALADLLRRAANPKVFWTAIETGEKRPKMAAIRCLRKGVRAGLPDLFFIASGLPIGLELKAARDAVHGVQKGRLSDSQKDIKAAWEAAGGLYEVVWGWDEAIAFLNRWSLIKGAR